MSRCVHIAGLMTVLALLLACQARAGGQDSATSGTFSPGWTFVQLFEWRWPDVAAECERVLGPAGIAAVQISPPNEHVDPARVEAPYTNAWWTRYQPISYRLVSRSGTEVEFDDMVRRCRDAGVGIIADAVINHMGDKGGVGIAGSPFDRAKLRYPDYGPEHFYRAGCSLGMNDPAYRHSDDPAIQAERARRVRECNLYELAVLDLDNQEVQATLAAYLQKLLDHGVEGLRIDGAKHIYPRDIAAILRGVKGDPFVFQEVIDDGAQSVPASEYVDIAPITEFRYGQRVGHAFKDGKLAQLRDFDRALLPSERAIAFIDNHDNQRGHGMAAPLSHRDRRVYDLANVFMLAWPYGTTRLMSSYAWGDDDNAGPPVGKDGQTLRVYRDDGTDRCGLESWLCEHRHAEVLRMVAFRRAVYAHGRPETAHWWDNGAGQVAFALRTGAGTAGFVAINRDTPPLEQLLDTGLPAGQYCNLLEGQAGAASCDAPVTVDQDGHAAIRLAGMNALALLADSPSNNGEPR